MKKIVLIICFLIGGFLLSNAKPKMVFECGKLYDWGTVRLKDSPLKAEIKIYNQGEDTLEIKKVKPMCGCTTAPLSKRILSPGDSAVLKVTLNIEQYEGVVVKRINFTTNETESEKYLEIKANVYQPIKLFPSRYLNFSRMFLNTESITKLVINNISSHDIKVTNLIVKPEILKLNLKVGDIIPKDSDFVLEAKVIPVELGQFNCRVELGFNDPDMPNVIISGWGKVDPESEKNVDYSKDTDTTATKEVQESKQGSPATVIPGSERLKLPKGTELKLEETPKLPVEPLVPDKEVKTETPENKVPVKSEPVQKIELGKPVEMLPPVEETTKDKKKK
jgi:hypothetical protein